MTVDFWDYYRTKATGDAATAATEQLSDRLLELGREYAPGSSAPPGASWGSTRAPTTTRAPTAPASATTATTAPATAPIVSARVGLSPGMMIAGGAILAAALVWLWGRR